MTNETELARTRNEVRRILRQAYLIHCEIQTLRDSVADLADSLDKFPTEEDEP